MAQQEITSPSGRTYQWTKPTPPTAEDWAALEAFDKQQGDAEKPGTLMPGVQMLGEVGMGAVKTIPRTVLELAQWFSQLTGMGDPQKFQAVQDRLAPHSTAESVGGMIGDVAQAVIPAAGAAKVGKAAEEAIGALRVVPSAVKTIAGLGARGAVEGGTQAAIAAAQEHHPLAAGLMGAAAPMVGAAMSATAPGLRASAEDAMVRALGPAGRQGPSGGANLAMAQKVAPQLLDRGFSAVSHGSALNKVGDALTEANQALDQIMSGLPPNTRVPMQPIINMLKSAKTAGQVAGQDAGAGTVQNKVLDEVIGQIEAIAGQTKSRTITPQEAVKLRRLFEPLAKWSAMNPTDANLKAEAYQTAYNGIREALNQVDSGIGPANKEISFWLNVKGLLDKSAARPTSGLAGTTGAVMGAGLEAAAKGTAGSVMMAGVVGRQLQRLLRSPGYRFLSAQAKDALAETLSGGDVSKASAMLGSLISQATTATPMASHTVPSVTTSDPEQRAMLEALQRETLRQYDQATGADKAALGLKLQAIQQQLEAIK